MNLETRNPGERIFKAQKVARGGDDIAASHLSRVDQRFGFIWSFPGFLASSLFLLAGALAPPVIPKLAIIAVLCSSSASHQNPEKVGKDVRGGMHS